jgi:hypothetical protein
MKKIIALLFLCSGWAIATNGVIQCQTADVASVSFSSVTLTNVNAGNNVVLGCTVGSAGINISTDSKGDTFNYAGATITVESRNINMLYATNVVGGTTLVYCNANVVASAVGIIACEYASSSTAGGFDVTSSSATNAGASSAFTSNSATTSQNNEDMISYCGYLNSLASIVSVSGIEEASSNNNNFLMLQDSTVVNAGSYASTGVGNTTLTLGFGCIQIAFKASAASTTGTHTYY